MSWLGAIAKGAAYLYGGSGIGDEDDPNSKNGSEQQAEVEAKQSTDVVQEQNVSGDIYASSNGTLFQFNAKKEEFRHLVDDVKALVVDHDTEEYSSSFQIIRQSGELLFSEAICNELQIQYNTKNRSMTFVTYNGSKDRLEILSFVFASETEEEQFKIAMAIKLYESNRQESFEQLLKTKEINQEEQQWLTGAYQMQKDGNSDYDETDIDLQELCDDVAIFDMHQGMVSYEDDSLDDTIGHGQADEDTVERNEDEEAEEKQSVDRTKGRNRWEAAAKRSYSAEEEEEEQEQQVEFGGKSKRAQNKQITGSKLFNRSYVVREMKPGVSAIGYFKHNDENELEYQGKIVLSNREQEHFSPSKAIQFKSDRAMLLLNDDSPNTINVLNLDKGKVVEEWQTDTALLDIAPMTKHEQMNDNPMVYGLSGNSLFQIDGRIPRQNKVLDSKRKQYKTISNMSSIATSGNGFIATAARDGKIRLYDAVEKKAKTCLPGLGNAVKHLEISEDGLWLLATCRDYIMVVPTAVPGTGRTGFEGRGMGKLKPHPYVLRLLPRDLQKYKLRRVEFTAAHFDQGRSIKEHWIISSTGPYIIKWNFSKLKKCGIVNSYSIRRAQSKVIHNEFRFDHNDDLLVSETNSVYAQHSQHRSKRK